MDASQPEYVPCTQGSDIQILHFSESYPPSNCHPTFPYQTNQFVATRSPMPYLLPRQVTPPTTVPFMQNHPPAGSFPSMQMCSVATSQTASTIPLSQNASTIPLPQPIPSKKRGRPLKTNNEATKKKEKKEKQIDGKLCKEESAEEDDLAPRMWPEHHVVALLHARCEMIEDFLAAPKQGVDLWNKVRIRVAATCLDFKKDSKACRKKFQYVFKQYQSDNTWNAVSGNDRRESCPHFKLLDSYFGQRANVKKHVHAGAIDVDDNSEILDHDQLKKDVMVKKETPEFTSGKKKTRAIALSLMEDVLATGKELTKSLERHGQNEDRKLHMMQENEARKLSVMEEMQKSFAAFLERMK